MFNSKRIAVLEARLSETETEIEALKGRLKAYPEHWHSFIPGRRVSAVPSYEQLRDGWLQMFDHFEAKPEYWKKKL